MYMKMLKTNMNATHVDTISSVPYRKRTGFSKFTGTIPKEIGQVKSLTKLNLSFNYISGEIPLQLCSLTNLEMLDLSNNFSRALRLRWLWLQWTAPEKTWAGAKVPCDDTDSLLFANCTRITLGNGKKSSF
jgi:hypothetical protein